MSKPCRTSEELLALARDGDREALGDLLKNHGAEVRRQLDINPRWRSVLEEDDIMQVTYFEAFYEIQRFYGSSSSFPAWLARIAHNNLKDAIDWLSRQKRPNPEDRLRPPAEQDSMVWLHELVSGTTTGAPGKAARNEMRDLLEAEIERLPETQSRVLKLMYIEELPIETVAATLNRTKGAIYLLRLRALERLRERLGSGSQFMTK